MTKLGHQQAPDPVDDDDLVTKRFGDANYAGGGIGTAALGDYLFAKLVAPVVYADAGVITFDTIEEQRGSITLVGGQFSLKAGRTYQMVATIQMTHTTGAVIPYQWRDATGAVLLGTVARAITDTGSSNGTSSQPSAYVFTPLVDTLVEVQMQAGGSTGADAVDGWAMVTEIGTVLAEVIGGLEFMDRFSPSTPVASFSFGASGDGVFKRELDGDVDEEYVLIHRLDTTSTVSSIELRPNGITTNQTSKRSTIQSSSGTFATMAIAQPSTVGYEIGQPPSTPRLGGLGPITRRQPFRIKIPRRRRATSQESTPEHGRRRSPISPLLRLPPTMPRQGSTLIPSSPSTDALEVTFGQTARTPTSARSRLRLRQGLPPRSSQLGTQHSAGRRLG